MRVPHLLGCQVPLTPVVGVRREEKLYSATVEDPDLRKRCLDRAEALENSSLCHVSVDLSVEEGTSTALAVCGGAV